MMKKAMMYLLVLALLLVAPFAVGAALTIKITEGKTTENTDKTTVNKDYKVSVVSTGDELVEEVEISFTYGSAITEFKCGDAGEFVASQTDKGNNTVVCKFESPEGAKGKEIEVGSLVLKATKNAADKDCMIEY